MIPLLPAGNGRGIADPEEGGSLGIRQVIALDPTHHSEPERGVIAAV
jgi:hypothetical protein